jgi:hypothetical protein
LRPSSGSGRSSCSPPGVESPVKYVQGEETVFSRPTSSVSKIEEMTMMGESSGVFRIVFMDGKIYNFMDKSESSAGKGHAFKVVKKKLGK